ncbi:MAG: glucosyltransferase [Clostridia bacterium]|nr:glucosyltransferase [Clostridia bacterium]
MRKIAFFCIPAHGHTNPTLGVVRELISRGHEVTYYSYNCMREKIEAAGAKFISCDEFDHEQRLSPEDAVRVGKDLAFSTQILVDTTLALDASILADLQANRPDCIVADSMAVWGKAAAFKLDIPFVSSTTTFAFNRHSAKVMKQDIGALFGMIFSMPKINRQVKRLQKAGYPVKSVLDLLQNDDNTHTVVYTSPQFQPFAETFSDKYAFVGPSVRNAAGEIEKTREKLVYISLGTVNNANLPFYRACVEAFTGTDVQVILSVGGLTDIGTLGELPDHIAAYSHVDQIAVLHKADVFLSHCGMNSASESLYFGVPLVMYPQTPEQGGVASRVLELGAGRMLEAADAGAVRRTVLAVMDDAGCRENAAAIGEGFRRCPGAAGAADKILSVCGD